MNVYDNTNVHKEGAKFVINSEGKQRIFPVAVEGGVGVRLDCRKHVTEKVRQCSEEFIRGLIVHEV